jgi:hypothetical protein
LQCLGLDCISAIPDSDLLRCGYEAVSCERACLDCSWVPNG